MEDLLPYEIEIDNDKKFVEKQTSKKLRDELSQSNLFKECLRASFSAEVTFVPKKSTLSVEQLESEGNLVPDKLLVALSFFDMLFTVSSDSASQDLKVYHVLREGLSERSFCQRLDEILQEAGIASLRAEARQTISNYLNRIQEIGSKNQGNSTCFLQALSVILKSGFASPNNALETSNPTLTGSSRIEEFELDETESKSVISSIQQMEDLNESNLSLTEFESAFVFSQADFRINTGAKQTLQANQSHRIETNLTDIPMKKVSHSQQEGRGDFSRIADSSSDEKSEIIEHQLMKPNRNPVADQLSHVTQQPQPREEAVRIQTTNFARLDANRDPATLSQENEVDTSPETDSTLIPITDSSQSQSEYDALSIAQSIPYHPQKNPFENVGIDMMRKKYIFNKELPREFLTDQLKKIFQSTKINNFASIFGKFLTDFEDKLEESQKFEHAAKNQGILWNFTKAVIEEKLGIFLFSCLISCAYKDRHVVCTDIKNSVSILSWAAVELFPDLTNINRCFTDATICPEYPRGMSNTVQDNFQLVANTFTGDFDYKRFQKVNLNPETNCLFFMEYMLYRVNSEDQKLKEVYNFYERNFKNVDVKSGFDDYLTKIILHSLDNVEYLQKSKNDDLPTSLRYLSWIKIYKKTFKKEFETNLAENIYARICEIAEESPEFEEQLYKPEEITFCLLFNEVFSDEVNTRILSWVTGSDKKKGKKNLNQLIKSLIDRLKGGGRAKSQVVENYFKAMTKNLPERLEDVFKVESTTHLILDGILTDKKIIKDFINTAKNEIKKLYDDQFIKKQISNSVQKQIQNLSDNEIAAGLQAMKKWLGGGKPTDKISDTEIQSFLTLLRSNTENSKEFERSARSVDALLQDKSISSVIEESSSIRQQLKEKNLPEKIAKEKADYTLILVQYQARLTQLSNVLSSKVTLASQFLSKLIKKGEWANFFDVLGVKNPHTEPHRFADTIFSQPFKIPSKEANLAKKHVYILDAYFTSLGDLLDYISENNIGNLIKNFKFDEANCRQLFTALRKEEQIPQFKFTWSFNLVNSKMSFFIKTLDDISKHSYSTVKNTLVSKFLERGMPLDLLTQTNEIRENQAQQQGLSNLQKEEIIQGIFSLAVGFEHLQKLQPFFQVFDYLKKNTIDSSIIQDIIVEETDFDKYNLSIRHLNYMKDIYNVLHHALDSIDESGDIRTFITNLTSQRIEEFKKKLELFDEATIKNVIDLLNQRSDQNRLTKKTLEIAFTQCQYNFQLKNEVYTFTIVQDSATGKNELTQDVLKEQIGNLRVAKSLIRGNSTENDYVPKIECLIKIYDQLRLLIATVTNIRNQGFITSLRSAYEDYDESDEKGRAEFFDDHQFYIKLPQKIFEKNCTEFFEREDSIFSRIEQKINRRSREILDHPEKYYLNFMSGLQYQVLLNFLYKERDESKENSKKALSLLSYSFDPKFIEKLEKKISQQKKEEIESLSSSYLTLERIDSHPILQKAIKKYEGRADKHSQDFYKSVSNPRYILYDKNSQKYEYYLKFASKMEQFQNHHRHIMFCTMYTTRTQIKSFLYRALNDIHKSTYFFFDLHLLNDQHLFFMLEILKTKKSESDRSQNGENENIQDNTEKSSFNRNLIFLVQTDASQGSAHTVIQQSRLFDLIGDSSVNYKREIDDLHKSYHDRFLSLIPNSVRIITSDLARLGKTYHIEISAEERKSNRIEFFITGDLNTDNLKARLAKFQNEYRTILDNYETSKTLGQNFTELHITLHIKLDITHGTDEQSAYIDQILFQLLFNKSIGIDNGYLIVDKINNFEIEVSNTFKTMLLQDLSVVNLVQMKVTDKEGRAVRTNLSRVHHSTIKIQRFKQNWFRFVAEILELLKTNRLDNFEFPRKEKEILNLDIFRLNDEARLRLILERFANQNQGQKLEDSTYTQLMIFIANLRYFFMILVKLPLKHREQAQDFNGSFRSEICKLMINLANTDAWSSVSGARSNQQKASNAKSDSNQFQLAMIEYRNTIRDYQKLRRDLAAKTPQISFTEGITSDAISDNLLNIISYISYTKNTRGIRSFEPAVSYSDKQNDYFAAQLIQAMKICFYDERLSRIQNPEQVLLDRMQKFKGKGYVLTGDNFMKILNIYQRARMGLPIVVCGETGCGKTHLIDFLASCLMGDEFRCYTMHAGVTQQQFISRIEEYVEVAQKLENNRKQYIENKVILSDLISDREARNLDPEEDDEIIEARKAQTKLLRNANNNLDIDKKVWILIDEFNTSVHQSLIAELMIERKSSFSEKLKDIPKNVVFVGCCNPFQFDISSESNTGQDEEVGLAVEKSTKKLTHRVFPINESILSYIYDFGQLSDKDEEDYIKALIRETVTCDPTCRYLKEPHVQDAIAETICCSQREIRKVEGDSSASLRDVARFIKIFKFFELNENLERFEALAITTAICYIIRIGSEEKKKEISELIQTKLRNKPSFGIRFKIQEIFQKYSEDVTKEAMEIYGEDGYDISVNKPLRENLVVILTCISLNLHVLICGKPGTSKTLAIDIANKILAMEFQKKPLLKYYAKATFSKFWGSITTTSEGVRKKFDLTIAEQIKGWDRDEKITKVLVFDEIGLAELAPDNPLKVLHSYLDPGSEDQSQDLRKLLQEEGRRIKDFNSKSEVEKLKIYNEIENRRVAFIGISNWKLDASKSNRMIFVARPKMTPDDLVCTSESMFFAYNSRAKVLTKEKLVTLQCRDGFELMKAVLYDIFKIVAQTYTAYREWEVKKCADKNLHGTRDYYYLIKHIIHEISDEILRDDRDIFANQLLKIVKKGIGRNFCGAPDSYREFLSIFKKYVTTKRPDSSGEGYNNWKTLGEAMTISQQPKVLNMISDNLKSSLVKKNMEDIVQKDKVAPPPPRHLYLSTEGSFIDSIMIDMIKKFVEDPTKVKVLSHSLDSDEDIETLSAEIPVYINEGYVLILKDMGKIYSLLQEVLNMRYKTIHKKQKSKLIYDDKERDVFIGDGFRCIILQNIKDKMDDGQLLGEAYAPFQNRLEKYIINFESLLEEQSFQEFKKLEKSVESLFVNKETNRIKRSNSLALDLILHNYSKELLLSIIVASKQSKFELEIEDYKQRKKKNASDSDSESDSASSSSSSIKENNPKSKSRVSQKSLYDELVQEYFQQLEKMYSRNLILTFTQSHHAHKEQILRRFEETHPYNGLKEFLERLDFQLNNPDESDNRCHLVFTYSYYGRDSITTKIVQDHNEGTGRIFKAEIVDISECKTNHDRMQKITVAYKNHETGIMVLALPDRSSWKYIEQIKFHLDTLFSYEENKKKKVVLIAHYGEKDFSLLASGASEKSKSQQVSTGISFLSDDWNMECIDDLVACDHKLFFSQMNSTIGDLVKSEDDLNRGIVKRCILESFEQLYNTLKVDENSTNVFNELKEYVENSESIFKIIVRYIQHNTEKNSLYELILKKGKHRELCQDYKKTINLILQEKIGAQIQRVFIFIQEKFDLTTRSVFDKYGLDEKVEAFDARIEAINYNEIKVLEENEARSLPNNSLSLELAKVVRFIKDVRTLVGNTKLFRQHHLTGTLSTISKDVFDIVHKHLPEKLAQLQAHLEIDDILDLVLDHMLRVNFKLELFTDIIQSIRDFFVELAELMFGQVSAMPKITKITKEVTEEQKIFVKKTRTITEPIKKTIKRNKEKTNPFSTTEEEEIEVTENQEREEDYEEEQIRYIPKQVEVLVQEDLISPESFNDREEVKMTKFLSFCLIFYADLPTVIFLIKSLKAQDDSLLNEVYGVIRSSIEDEKKLISQDLINKNISKFIKIDTVEEINKSMEMVEKFKRFIDKDISWKLQAINVIMLLLEFCKKFTENANSEDTKNNPFKGPIRAIQEVIQSEKEKDLKKALNSLTKKLDSNIHNGFWERYFGILTNEELKSKAGLEVAFDLVIDQKIESLNCDFYLNIVATKIVACLQLNEDRLSFKLGDKMKHVSFLDEKIKLKDLVITTTQKSKLSVLIADKMVSILHSKVDTDRRDSSSEDYLNFLVNEFSRFKEDFKLFEYPNSLNNFLIWTSQIAGFRFSTGQCLKEIFVVSEELKKPQDFTVLDKAIKGMFDSVEDEKSIETAIFFLASLKNTICTHFNRDYSILRDFRMNECALLLENYQNLKEEEVMIPASEKFVTLRNNFRIATAQENRKEFLQAYASSSNLITMLKSNQTVDVNTFLQKHLELSPFYQIFFQQFRQLQQSVQGDKSKKVLETHPQILEVVQHFMLMMEASKKTLWNISQSDDVKKWILPCRKPEDRDHQIYNIYVVMNTRNPNNPHHHTTSSTAMWQHSCGYLFTIGNCGNPNFVRACPQCGHQIGGLNDRALAGSRLIGTLNQIKTQVETTKSRNLVGYIEHSNDDLGKWAFDYWAEIGSADNIIFGHLLTHLVLLHREFSINAEGSNAFSKMFEHVVLDFERLINNNSELNPADICYSIFQMIFELFREITVEKKIRDLGTYVTQRSKAIFASKQSFRQNVQKQLENRANILKKSESREKTIYNWLNRMATDSQLERSFGPQVVYRSHYLRQYNCWNDSHLEEALRTQKKNSGLLSYFIYYKIFFSHLRKVLIPLVKLCLHLNNKYNNTLKRSDASEMLMSDFVEKNSPEDEELERLYNTVKDDVFGKKKSLETLHRIYVDDLKFELGCEEIQGLVEYYQTEKTTLSSYLINIDRPENHEGNMTAIIDALIEKQNTILTKFDELLEGQGNQSQTRKVNIKDLEEDDIIFVDENFHETAMKFVHSSPNFNSGDVIVVEVERIEDVIGRRVLDGKKMIEPVINSHSWVSFQYSDSNIGLRDIVLPQYYNSLNFQRDLKKEYEHLSYKDAEKMINTFDESQIASLESDIAKRIKTMHEKMVSSLNHSFKLENFSNISVADLGWLVDLLTYRKGFIAYELDVRTSKISPEERGEKPKREKASKFLEKIKGFKMKNIAKKMLYVAYLDLAKHKKLESENTARGLENVGILTNSITSEILAGLVDSVQDLQSHIQSSTDDYEEVPELEFRNIPCLIETIEQLTSKEQ